MQGIDKLQVTCSIALHTYMHQLMEAGECRTLGRECNCRCVKIAPLFYVRTVQQ
jgi:hypothetical protein